MQDLNIKIKADGKEASNQINKLGESFVYLDSNVRKTEFPTARAKEFTNAIRQSGEALNDGTTSTRNFALSLKELNDEQGFNSKLMGSSNLNWASWNQGISFAIQNLKDFSAMAKKAFDYFREGADFAEAEMNFKAYVQTMGYSADELVSKFRKATRNQVSDAELMKSAIKALRVAGIEDVNAISKLYEIADTKGDLLGLSLQDTFDKIVDSITSGNGRALVQLGVLSENFTKASNSANLLKNREVLLQEVIKNASADFKALANIGETTSDKFNQIEAAVSNLTREFKIQLADAAIPLIDFIRDEGIPIFKTFLEGISSGIKYISDIAKQTNYLTESVVLLGGAYTGLKFWQIIDGFQKIGGLVGLTTKAIEALNVAQLKFNLSAKANPYIAAGAAAGLGAYLIYLKKGELDANLIEQEAKKDLYNLDPLYRNRTDQKLIEAGLKDYKGFKNIEEEISYYREKIKQEQEKSLNAELELQRAQQPTYISGKTYTPAEIASLKAQTSISRDLQEQLEAREKLIKLVKEEEKLIKERNEIKEKRHYVMPNLDVEAEKESKIVELNEEQNKLADQLLSKYANLASSYKPLIANEKEAYNLLLAATKAAGGLSPHIENGTTAAGRLTEEMERVKAINDDINNSFLYGGVDLLEKMQKEFKKKSTGEQIYGMYDWFANGLLSKKSETKTEDAIEKIGQNMYEEFTAETANAITDGLLSADFSGFRQNLGSVIRSVTGNYLTDTFASILKGSNQGVLQTASGGLFKQVYTGSGNSKSLNVGNLLTNVGIGLGVSWLTGEGGLFGKRKIKGAENIDKSKSLNEQIDAAKTLRDDLLTAVGISEVTRQALEEAMFSYTWTSSHKNHNPFHRTKTYNLHGEAEALASIANLETLQKLAASEQANRNYQLWELSRGDTVGSNLLSYQDTISAYEYIAKAKNYNSAQLLDVLNKQNAEKANISSIQTQIANLRNSQQTSSSRNGKTSISREINKLEAQLTNAQNALASLIAEYNTGNSNKYSDAQIAEAKLAAEQAKQALISAQQSERSAFTSNFLNNSTLAAMYGNNSGILSELLGDDYSKFDTSSSIQQMLPMLEAAGLKDFNLQKAMLEAGNDTQKQLAVYNEQQGILEQALKTYEAIMKDNREEALNTRLSVEEQQAAFERWQESFNQVLAIQEEIASNTNTIAELEKNKYADSFAAQLSDVMTVVAEAVRQTNGKETVVYFHNVTGKEIIAKLKAAIQNGNVTNADDLLAAINETEQLEIWG